MAAFSRRRIVGISGIDRIASEHDPFVLALNHNNKLESVLLPSLFAYHRAGKVVHFLADWNFQLIPGVGSVMRMGGVITVVQKPARPGFLNVFRPLFAHEVPAWTRAHDALREGRSIGFFPEGRINRDSSRLLKAKPGAARLSIEAGVPVIPAGVRFPEFPGGRPIRSSDRMWIEFGERLTPPAPANPRRASVEEVRAWSDVIMRAISDLSGKSLSDGAAGAGPAGRRRLGQAGL
jgi:1-acyl-sn-glycerol-3-phosphate acyltransferase